jgi:periplasmic copper chaperone A
MPSLTARILALSLFLATPVAAFADHSHADHNHGAERNGIAIEAAYSRAMLPVAKVGGGYLTITNHGEDDRLVGASSERAQSVQIHEMKMADGIMEMREIRDGVAVPAHSTLELKPGGYHLMFMNVAQPFKEGETVKARLMFEKAGEIEIELSVGPVAGGKGAGHQHKDH